MASLGDDEYELPLQFLHYQYFDKLIDPHTADGIKVARPFVEPGIPMLVLETALPAKFSEVIEQALGRPAPVPAGLEDLEVRPQKVTVLPCDVASVRDYIVEHAQTH